MSACVPAVLTCKSALLSDFLGCGGLAGGGFLGSSASFTAITGLGLKQNMESSVVKLDLMTIYQRYFSGGTSSKSQRDYWLLQ